MGTLLEDLKEWYKSNSYPPDGPELGEAGAELVSEEDLSTLRWGTNFQNVYRRGDEFVALSDVRPATEYQDWGDYGEPEFYAVKPVEIVKVKYVKV